VIATLATLAFVAAPAHALTATTKSPADVTDTSATMRGTVDPGLLSVAPSFYFEYGRTTAYGNKTPSWSFSLPTTAKVTLLGLPSSTTVHYRIVATGLLSTARGADKSFTTLDPPPPPAPPPPPPPAGDGSSGSDGSSGDSGSGDNSGQDSGSGSGSGSGDNSGQDSGTGSGSDSGPGSTPPSGDDGSTTTEPPTTSGGGDPAPAQLPAVIEATDSGKPVLGSTVGAAPQSGSIEVKTPGASDFVPLPDGSTIPVGSTVDARNGSVNVVTAVGNDGSVQTATFHGAVFKVKQSRKAGGITDIYLRGGDFSSCRRPRTPRGTHLLAKKKRKHAVRKLWGHDHHGRFRTHGRGAIATVRGTTWVVADYCDGTRTSVLSGAVSVRDKHRHKTVLVHAGHSYFARTSR
jgi:hypothetical protein